MSTSELRELMRRLGTMGRRSEMEERLREEMDFHLDQQTKKNMSLGMDREAARRAAEQRFGGVDYMKEITRDEFRPALLEDTVRDIRYGVRTLMRAPGFALIAIITLGLGIGAATAVFSVVNGVLLRPLPYPDADRIVRLFQLSKEGKDGNVSHANFIDWKNGTHGFSSMAEMAPAGRVSVLAGTAASREGVTYVSRDFFDVMGVRPANGRGFAPEDQREGAAPVALVSDAYWHEKLGGRNVAGQTLRFLQQNVEVVGVMPPGFDYPNKTAIWVPSELRRPAESRTAHNFSAVARLKEGTSLTAASEELSGLSKSLKTKYGEETWMVDARAVPLREQLTASAKPVLLVLFGAAAFLLVIACANVSSLLLARAATRRRELAVRLALGAGRGAVLRQLMAESLVLCVAGGALGVFFAVAGVRALLAMDPTTLPRIEELGIDWVALTFAFGTAIVTALILGLATAARSGQRDLRTLISDDGRTLTGGVKSQGLRDLLVVGQVALTIVLVMAAGLLGRSFVQVLKVDPGYSTENALIMDIDLGGIDSKDPSGPARQVQFQTTLLDRLKSLPGVTHAAIINDFPLGGSWYSNGQFLEMTSPTEIQSFEQYMKLTPAERDQRGGEAGFRIASDEYFQAMKIPVVRGRTFQPGDAADAPHVAVISEQLAKDKWPDQDPIGRFVQFGNMDGDMHGLRIIGIVGDVREFGPEAVPAPLLYASYRQRPSSISTFRAIVRGPDPASITRAATQIVRDMDPQIPVVTRTTQEAFDRFFTGRRFSLMVIGVFSAVALVLATLGLYGVISYLVAQRTREIGIRTVLGAPASGLMAMVVGKGARLALYGAILGSIGAFLFARVLKDMMFGSVTTADPVTLIGTIGAIGAAVIAATAVPARRALRISPMVALRND